MPIEDWISDPIASERHERIVDAEPERALELAMDVPVGSDPIVAALLKMRGLSSSKTIGEFMGDNEFFFLQREPRELVAGLGAPVWTPRGGDRGARLRDPADWESWSEPRCFKAAMTFRAEPAGEGRSKVITETQVVPTDEWARRAFLRYWRVVAPFSALIRRRWLGQIAKAAKRE